MKCETNKATLTFLMRSTHTADRVPSQDESFFALSLYETTAWLSTYLQRDLFLDLRRPDERVNNYSLVHKHLDDDRVFTTLSLYNGTMALK